MPLRCLLFSSDEATAEPIRQVLAGLSVEGEHCSDAVAAVEQVTNQNFQIVIIDWDRQPEAPLLLAAARERKASERPLTLAIVSDDLSVPKALQAGANSILRKPFQVNQVRDTLTTARDLLRARQESAQAAAAGASAGSPSTLSASLEPGKERTLRAGEFLQSGPTAPGGQFVTEGGGQASLQPSLVEPVDPLKNLEPVAASVTEAKPPAPPPPPTNEPRGLEWYLKTRAGTLPPIPAQAAAPPAAAAKPELIGFEQTPAPSPVHADDPARESTPDVQPDPHAVQEQKHEQKKEAELFAYISGENRESEVASGPRFRLGKGAIIGALVLASCAIAGAPQAPWHPKMKVLWARGQQTLHGWLNPQPVTPVQAPVAHEDFGRAGDEYKLPVAENIPDATTDPSQIQVLPVIDPTAKKPNNLGGNAEQPPAQGDGAGATPSDQAPPSGAQAPPSTPEAAQPVSAPVASGPSAGSSSPSTTPAVTAPSPAAPPRSDPPAVVPPVASPVSAVPAQPSPAKSLQPHYASAPANVPSSLKSQMATMTPDASGNKPAENAMPSIEPVVVPEATERALLTDQPALDYPANARGQHGSVVLQVLIGRDGTVQDAKFMQGSLAFARTAIDGVKLWKFKPYTMNGRAVSVQTQFTISFKPAQ